MFLRAMGTHLRTWQWDGSVDNSLTEDPAEVRCCPGIEELWIFLSPPCLASSCTLHLAGWSYPYLTAVREGSTESLNLLIHCTS